MCNALTLLQAQSSPGRLFREVVAIPVEEVVALRTELTVGALEAAPVLELLLGAIRAAEGPDFYGVDAPRGPELVGAAPFYPLPEVVLLAEGDDCSVRDDLHGVRRAEELGRERPGHPHTEVVDCQMHFRHG